MIFRETATVFPHDVVPSVLEEARARGEDFIVLPAPRAPWLIQPGWQIAVGTRTPRIFRARQALARIFRR